MLMALRVIPPPAPMRRPPAAASSPNSKPPHPPDPPSPRKNDPLPQPPPADSRRAMIPPTPPLSRSPHVRHSRRAQTASASHNFANKRNQSCSPACPSQSIRSHVDLHTPHASPPSNRS